MRLNVAMYHEEFNWISVIWLLLNVKTVLFQTIQFSISILFISICLIDRTLLGQSDPGSYGIKRVPRIPQSSRITGASLSDCLVSYPGLSLGESYLSAVGEFCNPRWLGLHIFKIILLKVFYGSKSFRWVMFIALLKGFTEKFLA